MRKKLTHNLNPAGFAAGFALLLFSGSFGAAASPTPWERFLATPSSKNARLVEKIGYSQPVQFIPSADLDTLKSQVLKPDPAAVDLAFRLLSDSDGNVGEELSIMLGKLISRDPALFLTQLKKHRKSVKRMDALLGNYGEDFIDDPEASAQETQKRIAALNTVADKNLQEVKEECLSHLEKDR